MCVGCGRPAGSQHARQGNREVDDDEAGEMESPQRQRRRPLGSEDEMLNVTPTWKEEEKAKEADRTQKKTDESRARKKGMVERSR